MENKLLKTNSVRIIGKLVNADVVTGARQSDGQQYVSVTATIESTIDGKTNEYEVNFYSLEKTLEGKVSQLYLLMFFLVNKN